MGGCFSSCFHNPTASSNTSDHSTCLCPKCFFQSFINKHGNIFRQGQRRDEHSPNQQLSSSTNLGLASNNSSDAPDARERRQKDTDHLQVNDDVQVNEEKSVIQVISKEEKSLYLPSDTDEEDICPTCLEDYTEENPKIITKCCHHYHLSCIYEWKERSEKCPMCGKVMLFDE